MRSYTTKKKLKTGHIILIIIAVLIVSSIIWEVTRPYPGNDRNVEIIEIDEIYKTDNLTYTITYMELGKNFATVYYQVNPAKMILLDGLQVYSDGVPLQHCSVEYTPDGYGSMAYYVPDEIGEIELRIHSIERINTITRNYPLDFKGNKAQAEIDFAGNKEIVEVRMLMQNTRVSFVDPEAIYTYQTKGMYTDILSPFKFNLISDKIGNYSRYANAIPNKLQFEYCYITYSDDEVIIPIS